MDQPFDQHTHAHEQSETVRKSAWKQWCERNPDECSPITLIAATFGLPTATVASIVYPAEHFGEWSDDPEPTEPLAVTGWRAEDGMRLTGPGTSSAWINWGDPLTALATLFDRLTDPIVDSASFAVVGGHPTIVFSTASDTAQSRGFRCP